MHPHIMALVTSRLLLQHLQAMHREEHVTREHHSLMLQVTDVVLVLMGSISDSPCLAAPLMVVLNLSDVLHTSKHAAHPHPVQLDHLRFARS